MDNSFAPGIGKRLDGFPNHDLNPGAIIAIAPAGRRRYTTRGGREVTLATTTTGRTTRRSFRGVRTAQRPASRPRATVARSHIESLRRGDADARTAASPSRPDAARGGPESARLGLRVTSALQEYQLSLSKPAAPAVVRRRCRGARRGGVPRRRHMRDVPGRRSRMRREKAFADGGRERTGTERRSSLASRSATKQYRRRPYVPCGSTRRTSTTAWRRRSKRSSSFTTHAKDCTSRPNRSRTWFNT